MIWNRNWDNNRVCILIRSRTQFIVRTYIRIMLISTFVSIYCDDISKNTLLLLISNSNEMSPLHWGIWACNWPAFVRGGTYITFCLLPLDTSFDWYWNIWLGRFEVMSISPWWTPSNKSEDANLWPFLGNRVKSAKQ